MNIVIVGGGTAGWLAALFISKVQAGSHNVTLIESSDIGVIGSGEGSTGFLSDIINNRIFNFGCNEKEFLIETGATFKYGINHQGWSSDINESYIGPISGSMTWDQEIDHSFLHALSNLPLSEIHRCSSTGFLIKNNKSSYVPDLTRSVKAHGYHFDANLVGKYFKKISLASGVTCIDAKVHDVVLKENGFIKSLKLDIDQEITGDLFIDASGFSKILNKKLDSKWISYSKNLPVNSAMPFILPYSKGEEISPVTIARAQKNGWMWKIPTSSRYGSGYVFCDDFVTPEQAQRDIEEDLGHDIDPIRILKFDTGRLEKCWTKNCVSIGLSSAFAEPLEATSIHSTIVMLYWLVFDFLKDTVEETCNSGNEYLFNDRCNTMFDSFRDFLIAHYQGGRNDSEFWKYISSGATLNDRVKSILEVSKIRCMSSRDFHNFWGSSGWGLWSFVLAGTHNLTAKVGKKELKFYNMEQSALEKFNETEEHLKQNFSELLDNTKFINIINRKHQEYLKNL